MVAGTALGEGPPCCAEISDSVFGPPGQGSPAGCLLGARGRAGSLEADRDVPSEAGGWAAKLGQGLEVCGFSQSCCEAPGRASDSPLLGWQLARGRILPARLGGPPWEAQSPQEQAGPWGPWLPIPSLCLDKEGRGPARRTGWLEPSGRAAGSETYQPFSLSPPALDNRDQGHNALSLSLQNSRSPHWVSGSPLRPEEMDP